MVASELIYSPAAEDLDLEALNQQHNAWWKKWAALRDHPRGVYLFSGRFVLVEVAARGGGNNISSDISPPFQVLTSTNCGQDER